MNSKTAPRTTGNTAIMLVGFGGPERFEDVPAFIANVVAGRNVPQSRIDAVISQYEQIGGKSPFKELTLRQAAALESELLSAMKVHIGMLYWPPYIKDTLQEITDSGISHVIVIIMAVHRTEASYERYVNAIRDALTDISSSGKQRPLVEILDQWHVHPLYVEACADRVVTTLNIMTEHELAGTRMIFTAHSVPQEMADKSDYEKQVQATAAAVASRVRGKTGRNLPWTTAFQSRSGPPNQPWVEPDLQHELAMCKKQRKEHVIIVPVGFVCDHVEVLFDLDILAAKTANELGIGLRRVSTVGDHPAFIRLLAELAASKVESLNAEPAR